MSTVINPYTMARRKTDPELVKWGPMIAERLGAKHDDIVRVMNARVLSESDQVKRVRYAQMMRIAEATAFQARYAMEGLAEEQGISRERFAKAMLSGEALTGGVGSMSDIVTYITQTIHMQLDIWPRLMSNELVSIQPLVQPGGDVFFMRHYDQNDRELSDIDLHDPNFTDDPGEGEQITAKVRTAIASEHVECTYEKIMHETTHEALVKARTTFNVELEPVNDSLMARELTWNIDRKVIDGLVSYAFQDYYFDPTAGGRYASMDEVNRAQYDETFLRLVYNRVETDFEATVFRKPDWAIAGSEAINFVKRLRKFESRKKGGDYGDLVLGNGSVSYSGNIDDLNVWHDPQLDPCLMLVGTLDKMDPFYAGYIFCPFSAGGVITAAFMDPNNLKTRKAQAMAFAQKGVRRRQFAKIWFQQCS